MFGLDNKSLVIGLALGYFVLPRILGPVLGKITAARTAATDKK